MKEIKEIKESDGLNIVISLTIFFLAIGIAIFSHLEGWSILESAYYVSATLTTVGYGDITPVTTAGRILAIIYMWIGVSVAASVIGLVGSSIINKKVDLRLKKKDREEK